MSFNPGLYTLNTQTLPLLTNLMNWDKLFPVAVQVRRLLLLYAFAGEPALGHRHSGPPSATGDFGAVRLRAYGIYSYRIADPAPSTPS